MIDKWTRFCENHGGDSKTVFRGIEILNQQNAVGKYTNIKYYQKHGWQALMDAIAAEDVEANREREANRKSTNSSSLKTSRKPE